MKLYENGAYLLNGKEVIIDGPEAQAAVKSKTGMDIDKQTAKHVYKRQAVMIGGMVPPIAIALATIFFKNKFTAEERKAGPTNFIMGLSFITEGAIPFSYTHLHMPRCNSCDDYDVQTTIEHVLM